MPKLISFIGDYNNENVIEKVMNYGRESMYHNGIYAGGSAVPYVNLTAAALMFQKTQEAYGKTEGNYLNHFVICFNDKSSNQISLLEYGVWLVSQVISNYIGDRFQNVFFVHNGSSANQYQLHVHFVVNRVSYVDGTMFYANNQCFWDILEFARKNMGQLLNDERYDSLIWDGDVAYRKSEDDPFFNIKYAM